ncbi:ATP-binding protein [Streptodolium elevatio]|uniref:ATP-binding protein n=1 Tax=Streptodolium elevatio TaxID=3157996 RepID=A0ABV3DUW6_9ACTN
MSEYLLCFRVSNDTASVPEARHRVRGHLAAWGVHLDDSARDVLELLLSELVTNAVLHTDVPHIDVRITLVEHVLRVEVFDDSDRAPVHRDRDVARSVTAEGGRGLQLVAALADRHGHRLRARGKCVWAEVRLPGAGFRSEPTGEF